MDMECMSAAVPVAGGVQSAKRAGRCIEVDDLALSIAVDVAHADNRPVRIDNTEADPGPDPVDRPQVADSPTERGVREDDVARAVRCALAIVAATAGQADRIADELGDRATFPGRAAFERG